MSVATQHVGGELLNPSIDQLEQLYQMPFFDLIKRGREVYCANWPGQEVQLCQLLSIKTGGCSEDCSYCSQSARYTTGTEPE